jgi:hypothetical protein
VSDEEEKPFQAPDFAMARAVEILAQIYERQQRLADVPPPPLDKPLLIFNETIAFDVNKTTRQEVERALGIAFSYPARGWHTYCVQGENGREFLSAFYSAGELISAELYLPRSDRAPALQPRNLGGFRLVPGDIRIGMQLGALPEGFTRIPTPEGLGAYSGIFEARFPGGSAYAMGNDGAIERLAIYALREAGGEPATAPA